VQPSQPQQEAATPEFSVTLSVYSNTLEKNLCPNIIFSFGSEFEVNPTFPTSVLGIYNTEVARLYNLNGYSPAAKSGRDLDLTGQIYARYGLGQFDLNMLFNDFFPPPARREEKTRIYLCCCSGLIEAPIAPGSIYHHGNIPGVPSSPLVNNVSNQGVKLKQVHQAIRTYTNAAASGDAAAASAAHATLSQMIGSR
jgi:hypothetical protein